MVSPCHVQGVQVLAFELCDLHDGDEAEDVDEELLAVPGDEVLGQEAGDDGHALLEELLQDRAPLEDVALSLRGTWKWTRRGSI